MMRTGFAALLLAMTGCNEAARPVAFDEYECRSCAAGQYCPQFCTEK